MHTHCCKGFSAKFKPVTHVLFDLDGTIIDSEHVYGETIKHCVESYGVQYYPEFINKVKGSTETKVAQTSIETFNLSETVDDFLDKFHAYSNSLLGNLDLMPGVERVIKHFHKNNIPLAIATSSNQDAFNLKTNKHSDLISLFHHVVCGGTDPEVKKSKPAPDIFLIAASRFDPPAESSKCLVFEDSQNGVMAALAAGMQVVMVPDPDIPYDVWKVATLRIDSFDFLIPELFGLPGFSPEEVSPVFANAIVKFVDAAAIKSKFNSKKGLTIREPPDDKGEENYQDEDEEAEG